MVRAGLLLGCVLLLTACGQAGGGTKSETTTIEVGSDTAAFYMVSDNLDASSWKDDASSHKVAALPNGAAQVCKFTTSQGVRYVVWTTGTADSTDSARTECQRMGQ